MTEVTEPIIEHLSRLGVIFRKTLAKNTDSGDATTDFWVKKLEQGISDAAIANPWFTEENIRAAMGHWGKLLQKQHLAAWLSSYPINERPGKEVALILAGNIPMVGFHDMLVVWCTGNIAKVKYSAKDQILLPLIVACLNDLSPYMKDRTIAVQGTLKGMDAVIATGSNNTGRYFRHYFRHIPHIIRNNRTAVAVLTGEESKADLEALGKDVFHFFGLGCRNVSKIFLPQEMQIEAILKHWDSYKGVGDHHKYANNYHYHKSVWLMNGDNFRDTGFILAKEDQQLFAPLGTVYFEYYNGTEDYQTFVKNNADNIQCIVGLPVIKGAIPFGKAQEPALDDYADHIDTVDFLLKI